MESVPSICLSPNNEESLWRTKKVFRNFIQFHFSDIERGVNATETVTHNKKNLTEWKKNTARTA